MPREEEDEDYLSQRRRDAEPRRIVLDSGWKRSIML
jgi:hypothetical protein